MIIVEHALAPTHDRGQQAGEAIPLPTPSRRFFPWPLKNHTSKRKETVNTWGQRTVQAPLVHCPARFATWRL